MKQDQTEDGSMATRMQSLLRPNKTSRKMFASLLEFFTEQWSLSVKHLFDAEWGVFAALGFSLHATPSQVAFHFKRLMKTLEWNPRHYLGSVMWDQWQDSLEEEEWRKRDRERRRELERKRKQDRLMALQIELENEVMRRQSGDLVIDSKAPARDKTPRISQPSPEHSTTDRESVKKVVGLKLFNRLSMRRIQSVERLDGESDHSASRPRFISDGALPQSPSMPSFPTVFSLETGVLAIEIPDAGGSDDASSIGEFVTWMS
jgi:hypothetical protein